VGSVLKIWEEFLPVNLLLLPFNTVCPPDNVTTCVGAAGRDSEKNIYFAGLKSQNEFSSWTYWSKEKNMMALRTSQRFFSWFPLCSSHTIVNINFWKHCRLIRNLIQSKYFATQDDDRASFPTNSSEGV